MIRLICLTLNDLIVVAVLFVDRIFGQPLKPELALVGSVRLVLKLAVGLW